MSRSAIIPEQTETELLQVIRQYAETRLGIRLFRVTPALARLPSGGRFSTGSAGIPDLFGCMLGGRFLAIEVKKPGARPRKNETAQAAVLDDLRRLGALVIVARSVDDVAAALDAERGASNQ